MNCLEFRRTCDTEPTTQDEDYLRHKLECAACNAMAARASKFDQKLSEAMKFTVPEDLASKILVRQAFESGRSRWYLRSGMVALAASVLLVIGLAVGVSNHRDPVPALSNAVITLIDQAQHALLSKRPIALTEVRSTLRQVGVSIDDDIGVVTFAGPCVIRGKLAGHIVVPGDKAPISILLMPEERISTRAVVAGRDLEGILLPSKGGTIAILGAPGESLRHIEQVIQSIVRWQV